MFSPVPCRYLPMQSHDMRTPGTPRGCQEAAQCPEPPLLPISDTDTHGWSTDQTPNTELGVGPRAEREGVLNNLVQTGYQTTEPNQIGTQNSKRGENTTQTAKSPRPGASSRATAQHARIRPTALRDRHRLHHRGRERNRRRKSRRRAHAQGAVAEQWAF